MIQLEVWNTEKDQSHCHLKGKTREHYQLCTEVVQSQFLNHKELELFGNLCHSSSV
jgi:hypothetical protein